MTDTLFEDFGFNQLTERHIKAQPKKKTSKKLVMADNINIATASLFSNESEFAMKSKDEVDLTTDPDKLLKSKKLSLADRLSIINANVYKILGKQLSNTVVIKTRDALHDYITNAINCGRIDVDTETNNSLDPITCKLMGPCLYYPGAKQAYIPINHRDFKTKERLSWQLTEQDVQEELKRVVDAKIDVIMHNGKFDYKVIKCTCNLEIKPTWDTMICARLLDENERASLKQQYINKIDKTQVKYDIENLFKGVAYADVDPDVFALYAATDAMMTDKLYELQKVELAKEEYGPHLDLLGTHMLKGLRWLFHEVEMPIVTITAEMELTGVPIDEELGKRLRLKYENQLAELDSIINKIMLDLSQIIAKWRLTPEANEKSKIYLSKKSKMSDEKALVQYPYIDDITGTRYKEGASKTSQLENPVNLGSATQLAILFYDILGVNKPEKQEADMTKAEKLDAALEAENRKTGKDELKGIKEQLAKYLPKLEEIQTEFEEEELDDENLEVEDAIELSSDEEKAFKFGNAAKLADLLLKRRGIVKLLTTYIDPIPELAKHWPDGRIRFSLSSLGTDTGRYSSGGKWHWLDEDDNDITTSGINIQNIPSRGDGKITRLLFNAAIKNHKVGMFEDHYIVPETDEVETAEGWKKVQELVVGDIIRGENNQEKIRHIEKRQKCYYVYTV